MSNEIVKSDLSSEKQWSRSLVARISQWKGRRVREENNG